MKKVVVALIGCFFIILSFSFLYLKNEYEILKKENDNLIIEIDDIKKNIQIKNNENIINKEEIENLKNNNSDKLEEQEIWLNMKKKLEKALS